MAGNKKQDCVYLPGCVSNQRGVVLIVVLTLVAVTTVSVLETQRQSGQSQIRSAVLKERYELLEMATSAIHYGMAVLAEDKLQTKADTLREPWADSRRLNAWLNRSAFASGSIRLWIVDERSKIQINAIADAAYPEGISTLQGTVWAGLFDWFRIALDKPENRTAWLAELSERVHHTPLQSLDDFAQTKGWSRLLPRLGSSENEWRRYLTVNGQSKIGQRIFDGKININTAGTPVLASLLPAASQVLAERLVAFRETHSGSTAEEILQDPHWYRLVPGCEDLDIDEQLITTESDIFRIHATSQVNGRQTYVEVVVQRVPVDDGQEWDCLVLNWQVIG